MTVSQRFIQFLSKLMITPPQRKDGITKHTGVRTCLNNYYWGITSGTANSMLAGSWGKSTEVRPPRDIDVLFVLPPAVFDRYQLVAGNRQSQLLQEVKGVLARTFATTTMRADGQVILVPFATYSVEVVPAFYPGNGQYWICDTNGGGRYKTADPNAEIFHVQVSNAKTNGNARSLIRMMKRWQSHCNVPLKSFCLELLVVQFLDHCQYADNGTTFYHWMVRDFFAFVHGKALGSVMVPGTYETIYLGNAWQSRAQTAYTRAAKACEYESDNKPIQAGTEWQKIFGPDIPTG